MEHTPTPWRVGREGTVVADHPVPEITGSDMVDYYGGHLIAESLAGRNARRIVACVNACEGVPTETLEFWESEDCNELSKNGKRQPIDTRITFGLEHAVRLMAQRDQLAEALDGMLQIYGGQYDNECLPKHSVELECIDQARAALAAVKGE